MGAPYAAMLKSRSLLLLLVGSFLLSTAPAQTTLFSLDFETDLTNGERPAGWTVGQGAPGGFVYGNPAIETGNTSTRVLWITETGGSHLDTPGVDLTGYTDGTFTLSFDYFQGHGADSNLLIAFTTADDLTDANWVGTDSQTTGLSPEFNFDPAASGEWLHFELDVTDAVLNYLTAESTALTDFRVGFQNWVSGPGPDGQNIYLDNIALTATAVPEPSTYAAILGLAAIGLAIRRRVRRA